MKIKSFAFLLFASPIVMLSQKTKITTITDGVIIKNLTENKSITVPKNGYSKTDYFMAYKPGYATQVFKLDTVLQNPTYTVNLIPINNLDFSKVKNKLVFTGFLDKENKISIIEYVNSYQYRNIDLTAYDYTKIISEKLTTKKFKVVENEEVFKNKSSKADFALAGEILDYKKDTKGPGFQTSVVVKWTLFDIYSEETVLKFETAGYSNTGERISQRDALKDALGDAVNAFIVNEQVKIYMYGGNEPVNVGPKKEFLVEAVKKDANTDNMIEKAMQSSITIKTKTGHGSGFLISSDGLILTNYHVAEDSVDMQGIFQEGLTLPLKIIAFDKKTDVALCKIAGKGYKPLPLDTNKVNKKIGSDVIAIGTPQDIKLGQTVTKGIISGLREIKENIYIQTDVSINSGNSGGMLINKNGEVIGIVSAKIKGEGVEGLGFAIPIKLALKSLNIILY